jgi:hypothetical protein
VDTQVAFLIRKNRLRTVPKNRLPTNSRSKLWAGGLEMPDNEFNQQVERLKSYLDYKEE